ncbi:flagellar filament capping protein FliD [uncultured Sphingomonas sp.]|uniref:flagellar filament capping protein FliD n=1 Tax=uncultured Sphingomonas sp. TaxID=158754 RepID=UPI003747ABAA
MVDSIAKTLGSGSGIDISALVTGLVSAQFSPKTKQIESRTETLTAQISAVSELKSGMTQFASALASLVKGGSLGTQATSSNTGIVKASVIGGKQVAALSASIEVKQIAAAQVTASNTIAANTSLGAGSIKIQFGAYNASDAFVADSTDIPAITIDAANSTPSAIAAKINSTEGAGLTASVITDGNGERLVLKSATGAAKAFTITTSGGSTAFASALTVTANDTKIKTDAADAIVAVDGVEVSRSTNTVTDLIPGIQLDLQSAAVSTKVTLGSTPSTASLTQAVNDVVTTYNELYKMVQTATDPITGKLARDPAAQEMKRQLRSLTLVDLTGATDGSPRTLSELGVATNRDGSLSVDSKRLATVMAANPTAVEAMFSDRGVRSQKDGLSATLNAMSSTVTSFAFGLGAAQTRYSKAQTALTAEKSKLAEAQEKATTRMTQQYSTMDSRVSAYKATQSMLDKQIAAWNKS